MRAKVVSVKGVCELGHKAGDVVVFTDKGVDGPICVHALYSMMPKVFAMMFNAEFPWAKDHPDTLTHPCPDAANPVVFELARRPKRTKVSDRQKSGGACSIEGLNTARFWRIKPCSDSVGREDENEAA